MYVNLMSVDSWVGVADQGEEITEPTLEQVAAAIRSLDQKRRTFVSLASDPDSEIYMGIGGGNGQYVVYVSHDNSVFFQLIGSGDPKSVVPLFIGGQDGDYAGDIVVNLQQALSAAACFAKDGSLDSLLTWRKQ